MIDLLDLSGGRGSGLSLLGVTREASCLLAEGYYAGAYLRKGRRFTDPADGRTYRLSRGLKAGLYALGAGLATYQLDTPLVLEAE